MGCFTNHARDRALDRYGLDLTDQDLEAIYWTCVGGTALCGKTDDRGHIYMMRFRDIQICPVLSRMKSCIVTFMPSEFFASGRNLGYFQKKGMAKQRPATAKSLGGRAYRRERITLAQALEDEA